MNKKSLFFIIFLFAAADCLGNGLHYFFAGENYRNSDLRNYAVVGQIIFALVMCAYSFRYYKTSIKKTAQ